MPVIQERVSITVQTILLATDFTDASERAAEYAKSLAGRFSSTVEIAHVLDPSKLTNYKDKVPGLTLTERQENNADCLERVQNDFLACGLKAHTNSLQGHFVGGELLKLAKETKTDLIVLGTASKRGMLRHVLGSTAEELIRRATCPVLTVGPKVPSLKPGLKVFHSIVFATDFTVESAKAAMFALSFAEDSGAHLYFCLVVASYPGYQSDAPKVDPIFQAELAKMVPDSSYDWCSPECILEHGQAATGILALAKRVGADLIVVGPRKASFWLDHVEHGTTPDLLAEATCPVLTVC